MPSRAAASLTRLNLTTQPVASAILTGVGRRFSTFSFRAKIEGVFEIELERSSTQIAKLTVEPS